MISVIGYFLFIAATSFLAYYLFVALIAGLIWLFDRSTPYPRRTVLVIAAFLAIGSLSQKVPELLNDVQSARVMENAVPTLTKVYAEAMGSGLAVDTVQARVADLNVAEWPSEVVDALVTAMKLKAVRYGDLHQSMMLGDLIQTPVDVDAEWAAAMGERDERAWLPLLEAAAAGGPVLMEGGEIASPDHSWTMATTATRARLVVLGALADQHDVDVAFSSADVALSDAFEWLAAAMATGAEAELQGNLGALRRAIDYDTASRRDVEVALNAAAAGPSLARSYLTYAWALERVSLATERALIDAASSSRKAIDLALLNDYRRLLGIPIVQPADVEQVVTSSRMPWWAETVRQVSPDARGDIDAALAALDSRFAPFASVWSPPAMDLP